MEFLNTRPDARKDMYTLVRRFIKTGIFFLVTGLLIGLWIIIRREFYLAHPAPYLVSAHTHAILVGFVMMMIMGVALWLFPRPDKSDVQYSPGLASLAYWLMTIGTGGRILGEILRTQSISIWLRSAIVLMSVLQLAGLVVFFYTMWSRIRPVGSQIREAKGEKF